jgi:hypothetical protein
MWWQSEYTAEIAQAWQARQMVPCWDQDNRCMVERRPPDILLDKHWTKAAGARELRRRASRGTVIHNAIEDWCYGQRFDIDDAYEMDNYIGGMIEAEGMAIKTDYCADYVKQAILWCEAHIEEVIMTEAPVFNLIGGYAGTVDLIAKLKGRDGLWMIDAKTSKDSQPTHAVQQAAYANAELVGIKNTAERVPMPRVDHVANLYIQPEKSTLREWTDKQDKPGGVILTGDYYCFINLLQAYRHLAPTLGEDGKNHTRRPVTVKPCKMVVNPEVGLEYLSFDGAEAA